VPALDGHPAAQRERSDQNNEQEAHGPIDARIKTRTSETREKWTNV
jgi:hypothetical protein